MTALIKILVALFFSGALSTLCAGQDGLTQSGARSFGLANASLTLRDPFSLFNNVAGISGVEEISAFGAYDNRFGIAELQTLSAGVLYPTKFGTFGVSFLRFGDQVFSEQSIGIGYGYSIGVIHFGAKINYLQYNIEGFGTSGTVVTEIGATAQILEELSFGTHIYNLNQAKVTDETDERVPTVVRFGVTYEPTKKLLITTEVFKDIDIDPNFKAGLEYQIVESIFIRTGINTEPFASFYGLGWNNKRLGVDYSLRNNGDLGLGHHVSLVYNFRTKQ